MIKLSLLPWTVMLLLLFAILVALDDIFELDLASSTELKECDAVVVLKDEELLLWLANS